MFFTYLLILFPYLLTIFPYLATKTLKISNLHSAPIINIKKHIPFYILIINSRVKTFSI